MKCFIKYYIIKSYVPTSYLYILPYTSNYLRYIVLSYYILYFPLKNLPCSVLTQFMHKGDKFGKVHISLTSKKIITYEQFKPN